MIGGLIIDKPSGMTSHDVIARVRKLIGVKRVGHAGTLDPFATGVLVVCVGPATRLARFLVGLDKEYLATVRFGFATDTQDLTGAPITPVCSSKELSEEEVRRVARGFQGEQLQTPPMYSAKKIAGERLYKAARQGREIDRQPVRVTIHSIEFEDTAGPLLREAPGDCADLRLRVRCSSGTYIRTVAHDLGERLGVGAHLSELSRTAVGRFSLQDASTLEQLDSLNSSGRLEELVVAPSELVGHLPGLQVDPEEAARVMNGNPVAAGEIGAGMVRICDNLGNLLSIAEVDSAESVARPRVVLPRGDQ